MDGTTISALILFLFIFYQILTRVPAAYFSPLSKIPGPWYARFSGRRLKYEMVLGRRVHYVHSLHKRYGPIVRIAPHEVAILDTKASKEIHSVSSRFLKEHVDIGPVPNIFSMTDPKQHNARRRLYTKALSQASLRKNWEPEVRSMVEKAVEKMEQQAKAEGSADVFKWWMLMANDIIGQFTIGPEHGVMDRGEKTWHIITAVELHIGLAVKKFSPILYWLGERLAPLSVELDNIFSLGKQLYGYGMKAVMKVRTPQAPGVRPTFFAQVLKEAEPAGNPSKDGQSALSDAEICMDAAGFQLAGSDTVGITLTFLTWCVLQNQVLQSELAAEVSELGDVTDAACEKLPLLNAVIDETLRLHGAAPTALRRVVPLGGANLAGYRIPANTIVATQAYSLHRNPDIYKDPESFDPHRWITGSVEERLTKATDIFMPFGAGTRSCGGIYLARMELRIAAATFFRKFPGAKLAPSATPESMTVVDRFNTHPVGRKCEVFL